MRYRGCTESPPPPWLLCTTLAKRLVRGRIVTVGRGPLPNKLLHFQWNAHHQLHSATPKCTLEDGYSGLERIREKIKRASLDLKSWNKILRWGLWNPHWAWVRFGNIYIQWFSGRTSGQGSFTGQTFTGKRSFHCDAMILRLTLTGVRQAPSV